MHNLTNTKNYRNNDEHKGLDNSITQS